MTTHSGRPEPGEHPGFRRAGVLCKAGGGFETERILRWMQYERSIYSLANEKEKSSRSTLHLTYQIYNLGEETERQKAFLQLIVPKKCKLSLELQQFLKEHRYIRLIRRN